VGHIYRDHPPADAFQSDEDRYRRWLNDTSGPAAAAEWTPPMDVVETSRGVELVLDLPGVAETSLSIVFAQGTLVVAGRKTPGVCAHARAAFHLAERSFGRFVRAVTVNGAVDAGRATATLSGGELRVVLPRIDDRRGSEIKIHVNKV